MFRRRHDAPFTTTKMNTFRLAALALMLAACGGAAADPVESFEYSGDEPASPSAPSDSSPMDGDDATSPEAAPSPATRDDSPEPTPSPDPQPAVEVDPAPAPFAPAVPVRRAVTTPSPVDGDDVEPSPEPEPAVEAEPALSENGTACDADELCASGECSPVHRANMATTEGYCVAAPEDGTTHYCTWMNGECASVDRR